MEGRKQRMNEKTATELLAKKSPKFGVLQQHLRDEEKLSSLKEKMYANRHGVVVDCVCMVLILIVGPDTIDNVRLDIRAAYNLIGSKGKPTSTYPRKKHIR